MGQNKIENQIKEKLSSREIQPSAQAWDRLDAMLSVAEEKKTKRSFGWLYIAAGVLVFVSAGMFFFTQNSSEVKNDTIVETEIKKDSIQKENNIQVPILQKNQENQVAESTETQKPKSNNQSNTNSAVSIINQKSNQKQSNPLINREKQIEYQNSSDVALKNLPKIVDNKEIIVIRPKTNTMSDEDLLASLDNAGKKANTKSNVKVDARNLLSQVDGELDRTFREKVIGKIAKNYQEVKVALANRNQE
jgi:hypothetical protein